MTRTEIFFRIQPNQLEVRENRLIKFLLLKFSITGTGPRGKILINVLYLTVS